MSDPQEEPVVEDQPYEDPANPGQGLPPGVAPDEVEQPEPEGEEATA